MACSPDSPVKTPVSPLSPSFNRLSEFSDAPQVDKSEDAPEVVQVNFDAPETRVDRSLPIVVGAPEEKEIEELEKSPESAKRARKGPRKRIMIGLLIFFVAIVAVAITVATILMQRRQKTSVEAALPETPVIDEQFIIDDSALAVAHISLDRSWIFYQSPDGNINSAFSETQPSQISALGGSQSFITDNPIVTNAQLGSPMQAVILNGTRICLFYFSTGNRLLAKAKDVRSSEPWQELPLGPNSSSSQDGIPVVDGTRSLSISVIPNTNDTDLLVMQEGVNSQICINRIHLYTGELTNVTQQILDFAYNHTGQNHNGNLMRFTAPFSAGIDSWYDSPEYEESSYAASIFFSREDGSGQRTILNVHYLANGTLISPNIQLNLTTEIPLTTPWVQTGDPGYPRRLLYPWAVIDFTLKNLGDMALATSQDQLQSPKRYPFSRVAASGPFSGQDIRFYHQINGTTLGVDILDPLDFSWISSEVTIEE